VPKPAADATAQSTIYPQYFSYFAKEYPNQFQKLNESELYNQSHNMSANKVRKMEIWTWNPSKPA
jgi:hypothetical protein